MKADKPSRDGYKSAVVEAAGNLVTWDVMLAQKIALETDEHRAIAVANRFSTSRDLRRMLAREALSGHSRWTL